MRHIRAPTKILPDEAQADQDAPEIHRGPVDVIVPLVPIEPGRRAVNPMVATKALARLHATASNARNDASRSQCFAATARLVTLVCMKPGRSLTAWAFRRRDGLDRLYSRLQHHRTVCVGRRLDYGKPNTLPVDHNVALRAEFRRSVGFGLVFRPPEAGTLAEACEARVEPIWPALPRWSKSAWRTSCHAPAFHHSCRRREQVMLVLQPTSWGSICQGIAAHSRQSPSERCVPQPEVGLWAGWLRG